MNILQDILGLITKGKVKPPTDKDYMVVASYTDAQEILKPQPKMQANLVNIGALKKFIQTGGGGSQNLQQVTDQGNTTTNDVLFYNATNEIGVEILPNPDDFAAIRVWSTDGGPGGNNYLQLKGDGSISGGYASTFTSTLYFPSNITQNYFLTLPTSEGYLATSVNGVAADINGNITVSGISTPTLAQTLAAGNTSASTQKIIMYSSTSGGGTRTTELDAGGITIIHPGDGSPYSAYTSYLSKYELGFIRDVTNQVILRATNINGFTQLELPNSGSAARTLAVSVNGATADSAGNITVPAGATSTSQLTNDGSDGVNPFITALDVDNIYLPLAGGTMDDGADIFFDNGSKISEGAVDAGTGGSKGIALTCAVGFEWKFEAGEAYLTETTSGIISIKQYARGLPTVNDDITKGFISGSKWYTDNFTYFYECTDPTNGAAVWVQRFAEVNLQQVTDVGNITSNSIRLTDNSENETVLQYNGINFIDLDGGGNTLLRFDQTSSVDEEVVIRGLGGTMALLSDIPTPAYKVYTALISQSGVLDPTLVILENTLGQTVTAARSAPGRYSLNVTGSILLITKTWWTITNDNNNGYLFFMNKDNSFGNTNTVYIDTTIIGGVYTDGILQSTPIEIRVYN